MTTKQKLFRSVQVELECGCRIALQTSFYRLSKDRAQGIASAAARKPHHCVKHGAGQQLTKFVRTISS